MFKDLLGFAESTFRSSAKWVYAFNQSPVKVVTDPVYLLLASRLLRDVPPSERLMQEEIPDNLYPSFRAASRKLQYFIEDWDFSEAKPELLTERQRHMMHTVALGETSGTAVSDGFLRAFRTSPELAAFFGTWFVEELNHFVGYHLYLEKMNERWPIERGIEVAEVEFIPYAKDPLEVAACNMYQELLGFLIYRRFSSQVKDPFLSKMLAQFAKDELRHYKFYQQVVVRAIQKDPDFRKVVLKVFLKSTTPYNQVSGGAANVLHQLESGAFYFRKAEFDFFLREVKYLLGTNLESLFSWWFKDLLPECDSCKKQPFQCECENFEEQNAPHRPPRADWWKKTKRRGGLFGRGSLSVPTLPKGGIAELVQVAKHRRDEVGSA